MIATQLCFVYKTKKRIICSHQWIFVRGRWAQVLEVEVHVRFVVDRAFVHVTRGSPNAAFKSRHRWSATQSAFLQASCVPADQVFCVPRLQCGYVGSLLWQLNEGEAPRQDNPSLVLDVVALFGGRADPEPVGPTVFHKAGGLQRWADGEGKGWGAAAASLRVSPWAAFLWDLCEARVQSWRGLWSLRHWIRRCWFLELWLMRLNYKDRTEKEVNIKVTLLFFWWYCMTKPIKTQLLCVSSSTAEATYGQYYCLNI